MFEYFWDWRNWKLIILMFNHIFSLPLSGLIPTSKQDRCRKTYFVSPIFGCRDKVEYGSHDIMVFYGQTKKGTVGRNRWDKSVSGCKICLLVVFVFAVNSPTQAAEGFSWCGSKYGIPYKLYSRCLISCLIILIILYLHHSKEELRWFIRHLMYCTNVTASISHKLQCTYIYHIIFIELAIEWRVW